jgi:hypothetical protein
MVVMNHQRSTISPSLVRRLNRAFLLAFVSPALMACSSSTSGAVVMNDGGGAEDSSRDASAASDASAAPDGAPSSDAMSDDAISSHDTSPPDSPSVEPCALDASLPVGSMCTQYAFPPCGYDGGDLSADCTGLCPVTDAGATASFCYATTSDDAAVVQCNYCGVPGRRPQGLGAIPPQPTSLGEYFARCAFLEAASVPAFRRLARELRALGAGDALVASAERSARQEVRHARRMTHFARQHGATPARPRVARLGLRDARSVALENAVEGCVREAYGALVAKWQAERVVDPDLKRTLKSIARDEIQHAALAWHVAAWLEPRLSAAERREIDDARRQALAGLRAELAQDPPEELSKTTGLPSACEALRLLQSLQDEVVVPLGLAA